jgi:hypothetical protein
MTALIIIAIVLVVYFYFNNQSNKEKAVKEKQELEQKRLKEQRVNLERKIQIEEAQKQKVLIEKKELEQKRLKEQRVNLERKIQIEEAQKQKVLKEKQELEQKRDNDQRVDFEKKIQIEDAQKQKAIREKFIRENEQENKKQFQNKFIICSNDYLCKDITAFYHTDYHSGGNWKIESTIENMIWTLKNDSSPFPLRLPRARQQFENILSSDLPQILSSTNFNSLTVCVVPRAKKDSYYRNDQLYFRQIINDVVNQLNGFQNGTEFIKRHTNTKTTHLKGEDGGDGKLPYIGITKNTCTISNEVQNKDILLIDDIYTKGVNIDEDAIQALLDNGAKSIFFYAIGKTVRKF